MRCGKSPYHPKDLCPSKEAVCHQCNRTGYMNQWHSKTVLHEVKEDCESDEGQTFLRAADSNTQGWCTTVQILEQLVKMKMDSGADVTAIPNSVFMQLISNNNTGLKKTRDWDSMPWMRKGYFLPPSWEMGKNRGRHLCGEKSLHSTPRQTCHWKT